MHENSRKGSRGMRIVRAVSGVTALGIALSALVIPSPYVMESPGPIFNTIGEDDGEPIITVNGHETYETDGSLNLTTVFLNGAPTSTVRVADMVRAWFDGSRDIAPQELIYPSGTTADEVQQMNSAQMTSSQDLAVAAALDQLDEDYAQRLSVADFTPEAQEAGTDDVLQPEDEVVAASGEEITGIEGLREAVNEAAGEPVELTVQRDGDELDVEVPTYLEADGDYYVGIMLQNTFDFPFEVDIRLNDVGGPSAGLMFTLGIIDTLTSGSMTGGEQWAGTGTVDPDGRVGPIGGIPQKVVGAADQGAQYFLAPQENCSDLEGRIPDGIDVYPVTDVEQAQQTVEAVREDDEDFLAGLPSCGE